MFYLNFTTGRKKMSLEFMPEDGNQIRHGIHLKRLKIMNNDRWIALKKILKYKNAKGRKF